MKPVMSVAAVLVLVLTAVMSVVGPGRAGAASGGTTVYIGSLDGNQLVTGSCVELRSYSRKGCDENGDGFVRFANIPAGRYTVHFDSVPSGYDLPKDRSINVRVVRGDDFYYEVDLTSGQAVDTRDLAVVVVDANSGERLTGACLQLHGYSKVGCDENGDGQVDFKAIPYGTYQVDVQRAPDGYQTHGGGSITVSRSSPDASGLFYLAFAPNGGNGGSHASGSANIAIAPFDNETNDSLTGACFQFVGYSKVGCDDNGDGAVMFADIPYGTYTVRVTTAPHGYYPTYGDTITITVSDGSDVSDGTAYYFAFSQY